MDIIERTDFIEMYIVHFIIKSLRSLILYDCMQNVR